VTYMEMLQGSTRTNAPVIKRAVITDARSANCAARVMQATDYRPDPAVLACMRQSHSFCG
jgi:hypothetical protein